MWITVRMEKRGDDERKIFDKRSWRCAVRRKADLKWCEAQDEGMDDERWSWWKGDWMQEEEECGSKCCVCRNLERRHKTLLHYEAVLVWVGTTVLICVCQQDTGKHLQIISCSGAEERGLMAKTRRTVRSLHLPALININNNYIIAFPTKMLLWMLKTSAESC